MKKKYEICLRLSPEEKERLESSARRCGLSKTAYLRRLIQGAEIRARPAQEIKELRSCGRRSTTSEITSIKLLAASTPGLLGPQTPSGVCSCWIRFMS